MQPPRNHKHPACAVNYNPLTHNPASFLPPLPAPSPSIPKRSALISSCPIAIPIWTAKLHSEHDYMGHAHRNVGRHHYRSSVWESRDRHWPWTPVWSSSRPDLCHRSETAGEQALNSRQLPPHHFPRLVATPARIGRIIAPRFHPHARPLPSPMGLRKLKTCYCTPPRDCSSRLFGFSGGSGNCQ
jgi:hypothetical protein